MVTNLLYTFSNKRVTTMRNKTNKCIYKYVNVLYYKHVGGYTIYATINLHFVYALVGFVSHNESSVHGHEPFKHVTII
jgi:hypothetical protein